MSTELTTRMGLIAQRILDIRDGKVKQPAGIHSISCWTKDDVLNSLSQEEQERFKDDIDSHFKPELNYLGSAIITLHTYLHEDYTPQEKNDPSITSWLSFKSNMDNKLMVSLMEVALELV